MEANGEFMLFSQVMLNGCQLKVNAGDRGVFSKAPRGLYRLCYSADGSFSTESSLLPVPFETWHNGEGALRCGILHSEIAGVGFYVPLKHHPTGDIVFSPDICFGDVQNSQEETFTNP